MVQNNDGFHDSIFQLTNFGFQLQDHMPVGATRDVGYSAISTVANRTAAWKYDETVPLLPICWPGIGACLLGRSFLV